MIGFRIVLQLLAIASLLGCGSTNEGNAHATPDTAVTPAGGGGDTTEITPLPFSFSYTDDASDIRTTEEFLRRYGVSYEPQQFEHLFNTGTALTGRESNAGHPYNGPARLFRRLPDADGHRVLLFAYVDRQSDYKLATVEMQIFDRADRLTDKMIVADGTSYECAWERTFSIAKNYELEVADRDVCWDVETDSRASDTTKRHNYRVAGGKIQAVSGGISSTPVQKQAGIWNGTYTLTYRTGEVVTGAAGNSVDYTIRVSISVNGDAVVYTENHTRDVALKYRCRLEPVGQSALLYAEHDLIRGEAADNVPLCTIMKRGSEYYFMPGRGSRFTTIDPIPVGGLRLKR